MPTIRGFLGTATVNGRIYAIGGLRPPNVTTVEEYDPATDTLTKKADMPYPRSDFSISVVNGKIYIFGGVAALDWVTLAAVEEYDPVTETWTRKADMPTPRSKLAEKAPANGKLAGGDKASITGSGFLPGATVSIGGVPATNVGITPKVIAFTIPPGTEGAKDVEDIQHALKAHRRSPAGWL